jgi:hypothetical protein
MRFVLTYDGPLPVNGNPDDKHRIRKQFHPQLKAQWDVEPSLQKWARGDLAFMAGFPIPRLPDLALGGYIFRPMVTRGLHLVCFLDITFNRREEPGSLVRQGGDIDNRLKTLFDSLRIPRDDQEVRGVPEAGEELFYCLLEDDALITGFRVQTERLLKPPSPDDQRGTNVHLDIAVVVRPAEVTNENIRFLGGWAS